MRLIVAIVSIWYYKQTIEEEKLGKSEKEREKINLVKILQLRYRYVQEVWNCKFRIVKE